MSVTTLNGVVQKVFWDNRHTGQCGMVVKAIDNDSKNKISTHKKGKDEITVVGICFNPKAGEHITCEGSFVPHEKFGMQFKSSAILPTATIRKNFPREIVNSNILKYVRKQTKKKIIDNFGDNCLNVLLRNTDILRKENVINENEYNYLVKERVSILVLGRQYNFLRGSGVSGKQSTNIIEASGSSLLTIAANNPYEFLNIKGVGYAAIDMIASSIGMDMDSDIRVRSIIFHSSDNKLTRGSSGFRLDGMCKFLEKKIGMPKDKIKKDYIRLIEEGSYMISKTHDGEDFVYDFRLRREEMNCAKNISRIIKTPFPREIGQPSGIPHFLNDGQVSAIHNTLKAKLSIITGGPGVGKTTVVNTVVEQIKFLEGSTHRVVMAAPTGKAARRMHESTGHEAQTIHTTLEYDETGRFKRDERNALKADTVIIDESSMMDISIFLSLLRAIPSHARVIFVGDVDQLASVGPGAVLQDMISSNTIPVSILSEPMRQAANSMIIKNAHLINNGEMPILDENATTDFVWKPAKTPEEINAAVTKIVLMESISGEFDMNDIQVLSPMGDYASGVTQLNKDLRDLMNPYEKHKGESITAFNSEFRLNDRVMQTKNDKTLKISNGDVGLITSIDRKSQNVVVDFDGKEVSFHTSKMGNLHLAYSKTIHKSQGSEYGVVIIPVCEKHSNMLTKQLLYTAITRGKKKVYLVGSEKAMEIAVSNRRMEVRETFLDQALVSEVGTLEFQDTRRYIQSHEAQNAL